MTRTRRFGMFALVVATAATCASCAGILGFKHLRDADDDAGDASRERDGDDGAHVGGPCEGAVPPARGSVQSGTPIAPAQRDTSLFFAFRSLHYDRDPVRPGFNLDKWCTTGPESNACVVHAAEDFSQFAVDDDGGVDNAFASLPQRLAQQFFEEGDAAPEFSSAMLTDRIERGRFGAVVELANWNGTSEDARGRRRRRRRLLLRRRARRQRADEPSRGGRARRPHRQFG